jgi:hypothetical protein
LSNIQRVPIESGCAFAVIVSEVGREGEDDMVKVRWIGPPARGSSSVRNWPGSKLNKAPDGLRKEKVTTFGASGKVSTHSSSSASVHNTSLGLATEETMDGYSAAMRCGAAACSIHVAYQSTNWTTPLSQSGE